MADSFDVGSVVARVTADISGFTQGIEEAKAEASSLGQHLGNIADSVRSFAEKAAVVVGVQALAFKELAGRAIEVASNFEQTQTSFGTLLGSEQKAADLMKEIMSFEQHTPFDITTLTNGAKQMLAFGVNTKNVVPIMSELTDMSQGQADKLNELISIYGQVNSIQQLNGREVLRLSSIGIPIYQAIEDHFKKIGDTSMDSGEKVKNAISKGQITAETFNQVLGEMTGKGGMFFQENTRQMSTFSGIMSSTKSQLEYSILHLMGIDIGAANEVRKGGLFDTLRSLAEKLLDGLHKLQPVFDSLGKNKNFQLAVEGIVVALGSLVIIIPIVIAVLNPVVLIVLGIEAVIVLLYIAWNNNFLGIRDTTKKVVDAVLDFFNNYLMPLFDKFEKLWKQIWPELSAILKAAWEMIWGSIKFYWDLAWGVIKIGIDLLTGNWKKAWEDVKKLVNAAWKDIKEIFDGAVGMIKTVGKEILSAIIKPFEDAWNTISGIVNKIKDALDFTKRHSPSVLDIVQNGVYLVNQALQGINMTPQVSTTQIANNILSPLQSTNPMAAGGYSINVDMSNAIVSDSATAAALGEKIGDSIISKLKQNIRF